MNITRKEYKALIDRIDRLNLEVIQLKQGDKDLDGQLDYQRKTIVAVFERIETIEEVIEEEFS